MNSSCSRARVHWSVPSVRSDDLGRRHRCVAIATDLCGAELQLALLYCTILFFALLYYSIGVRGLTPTLQATPPATPSASLKAKALFLSKAISSQDCRVSLISQGIGKFINTQKGLNRPPQKQSIQPLFFIIFQTRFETVLKQKRIKIESKPLQNRIKIQPFFTRFRSKFN